MLKWLIALTTLFPAAVLAATIWTWVDEQGQRHYSDRQVPGATPIEVAVPGPAAAPPQASGGAASGAAPAPRSAAATEPTAAGEVPYTVLDVISPEPEQTFWNIGGSLSVEIATYPALAAGHRIDAVLDGERVPIGSRSLQVTVPEVYRGEHTLSMLIVDAEGNVLMRSSPVRFYVHQTSLLN